MTIPAPPPGDQKITTSDPDWRQLAVCRHAAPELFFPVSASGPSLDQITQAKAIGARSADNEDCEAREH